MLRWRSAVSFQYMLILFTRGSCFVDCGGTRHCMAVGKVLEVGNNKPRVSQFPYKCLTGASVSIHKPRGPVFFFPPSVVAVHVIPLVCKYGKPDLSYLPTGIFFFMYTKCEVPTYRNCLPNRHWFHEKLYRQICLNLSLHA